MITPTNAAEVCRTLLNAPVLRTESTGGTSRESLRVYLEDRSVIVTRRESPARAELEDGVLRELAARGVAVPRVLAFDGTWLVQEDLGVRRLSQALADATEAEGEGWLDAALGTLAAIHRAGEAAGLDRRVAVIGGKPDWLPQLLATPQRLARHLDLPAPELPVAALTERLRVRRPRFIKWDARPGNAIAREDGSVAWFDWEHCGCRNRLDDVAWFLGDEFVPDRPAVEARLVDRHLPAFAGDADGRQAGEYLATFGSFHMCVRLALIVEEKEDGPWWDWRSCVADDTVGVTLEAALRTCRRAARWAERTPLTEALSPWFERVARRLEDQG